jgi:hypothetical protein
MKIHGNRDIAVVVLRACKARCGAIHAFIFLHYIK